MPHCRCQSCHKSGWYYEKKRREKAGIPILSRGRPRQDKTGLLSMAKLHGWNDEDSIDNKG